MSKRRRLQTGISFVESAAFLAIAAIVLGSAVPSLQELRERHRLASSAGQLESELQWARSQAVARQQQIHVAFPRDAGSCYVIHTGSPRDCDCTPDGRAVCRGDAQMLRVAALESSSSTTMRSTARSIAFDPDLGTVTPTTTLELENRRSQRVRLVLNIAGRIRSCTVIAPLLDLPAC